MKRHTTEARRRHRGRAAVLAVAVVLTGLPAAASAQVAEPVIDGRSPATAAASCWEIKDLDDDAPSGVYWLRTPELIAPQQFYCDQSTDGGGWVLIGRGREGWQTRYDGLGSDDQVHTPHTGSGAFQPRQLHSKTIDALLDGGRVDALPDGIRLRRARNSNGTNWQEVRFQFQQRDRWVWVLDAKHDLSSWRFDNSSGTGQRSHDFGSNSSDRRVVTTRGGSNQNWTHGFAYGSGIAGQNNGSTYLWSAADGRGSARPFTQVYLRPQLRTADLDYPAIPDAGTPETAQSWLPESRAMPAPWAVTGLANGRSGELNTEVQAFAQIGDRVFVGGNFRYVRNQSTGVQTEQSYLAAFDVETGAWISDFRPSFDGQIKALAALPDGRLAVGGEFGEVDGEQAGSLVVLDAATGAIDDSFPVDVESRISTGARSVRSLSVHDGWLYVAGFLTHITGGPDGDTVWAQHAGRVSVVDGTPDADWNPRFGWSVVSVDASDRGDRLYAAGYFETVGADEDRAYKAAVISTASGAAQAAAWEPEYSTGFRSNYQQAVQEVGDRVWLGGSEHSLFSFDRDEPNTRLSSNILNPHGDMQVISTHADVVFAGCHCENWNFSGATGWLLTPREALGPWYQADKIGWLGAWDADTGEVIPDFNPVMGTRSGHGAWASFTDSNGNHWVGGDFTSALRPGDANQSVGGFVRFPGRDTTAPTTPGSASVNTVGDTLTATWAPSTDDREGLSYEVLRDDRVIALTSSTSVELPAGPEDARYFVRAVDAAGNRSASTPRLDAPAPGDPSLPHVDAGSNWRWRFQQGDLSSDWRATAFDDSSWSVGAAPLGFGSSDIATDIDVAGGSSDRPLSAQFRHDFEVEDPTAVGTMTISTHADDGVAVFVNGTEVGRTNLPTGNLTLDSYATAAPSTAAARSNPVTYAVPRGLLREGTNTIAAQTHLNYRSTPSLSFDLSTTATAVDPDAPAPARPELTATATAPDTVELTWSSDPDVPVSRYEVRRDGVLLDLPAGASNVNSYTDEGLTPDAEYSYEVVAVGASGLVSEPGTATVRTPAAPGAPLLAEGSQWDWRFQQGDLDGDWREPGFDASSWSNGVAPLGFGSTTVATDIDVAGGSSDRPLSAQFLREVTIDDLDGVASLAISTYADDGVAVFVNGTEVGRTNLPTGTLTTNTYATAAPRTPAARGNPATYTAPRALLREGVNTVAVQTHLNYRATPDLSFDLSAALVDADPDADPPAQPTLTAEATDPTTIELTWQQPAGNAVAAYRIARDGEQIAVVTGDVTNYTDQGLDGETTYAYAVTAVGTAGAASEPATASATTAEAPLIAAGSAWQWLFERDGEVPADWRETGFDASGWDSGSGPLGFGPNPELYDTDIDVTAGDRPMSALFRHDVTIDDLAEVGTLELTTWADDGVAVYVNDTFVGQSNMRDAPPADGSYPLDSYASDAPRTTTARGTPVTFTVLPAALREGTNTIAVQTHRNWSASPDLSFDLSAVVVPPDPDAEAPAQPDLDATVTGPTSVELAWTHDAPSDVAGYRLERDGELVRAFTTETSYTDTGLTPGTAYVYELVAVSDGGARSTPASVGVTTDPAPVLAAGSDWRWRFAQGDDVPADWYATGFDTSAWSTGAAPLGFGSSTIATDIDVDGGNAERPLAALFQRELELDEVTALELTTWADDGIVVHVNGTEVGRRNLPTGPVTFTTYATAAPRTGPALASPVTWTVPADVLVAGTNTISAQVHLNYRSTPDISFELSATPADG